MHSDHARGAEQSGGIATPRGARRRWQRQLNALAQRTAFCITSGETCDIAPPSPDAHALP